MQTIKIYTLKELLCGYTYTYFSDKNRQWSWPDAEQWQETTSAMPKMIKVP